MGDFSPLPLPTLRLQIQGSLAFWTDDALASSVGVSIAFTQRQGGVSPQPYDSLNLATHVADDPQLVAQNRELLLGALGFPQAQLVVPNQVHGTNIVAIESSEEAYLEDARHQAQQGADALLVTTSQVAALLNFADCLPVIVVSPLGHFAVAHAGWRGAVAGIAGKALNSLAAADAQILGVAASCVAQACNIYIGPYIHQECFEVGEEVAAQFAQCYGEGVVPAHRHVDLGAAVKADACFQGADPQRIADLDMCTQCNTDRFFSYRASGGVCGRHSAVAIRR